MSKTKGQTSRKVSAKQMDPSVLRLKKGTKVTYTVSVGSTGQTMRKKATVIGHVPAGTSLLSVLDKLPRKQRESLTEGAIRKIGPDTSDKNRYLVFSQETERFGCPIASKLNGSN